MYCLVLLYLLSVSTLWASPERERTVSTPDQICALTACPGESEKLLFDQFVDPLSGHSCLRKTDLIVKGAQEILLERTYVHPWIPEFAAMAKNRATWDLFHFCNHMMKHYVGWQFMGHTRLWLKSSIHEVLVCNRQGVTLPFRLKSSGGKEYHFAGSCAGLSNFCSYHLNPKQLPLPSATLDLRRTKVVQIDDQHILVTTPTFERLHFVKASATQSDLQLFLLEKEVLANGKVLKYSYDKKQQLREINSFDPLERHRYATLRLEGSEELGFYQFFGGANQTEISQARYNYTTRKEKIELHESGPQSVGDIKSDYQLPHLFN